MACNSSVGRGSPPNFFRAFPRCSANYSTLFTKRNGYSFGIFHECPLFAQECIFFFGGFYPFPLDFLKFQPLQCVHFVNGLNRHSMFIPSPSFKSHRHFPEKGRFSIPACSAVPLLLHPRGRALSQRKRGERPPSLPPRALTRRCGQSYSGSVLVLLSGSTANMLASAR